MSIAEIRRLAQDLQKDDALKEELEAVKTKPAELVSVANGKGYDFSLEELRGEIEKDRSELRADELETVVGGSVLEKKLLV